jgi:hypothetical protein
MLALRWLRDVALALLLLGRIYACIRCLARFSRVRGVCSPVADVLRAWGCPACGAAKMVRTELMARPASATADTGASPQRTTLYALDA